MELDNKYIIVGGGLSGLTLAYQLSKKNINAYVLEASSRLGGRIQTIKGKNPNTYGIRGYLVLRYAFKFNPTH